MSAELLHLNARIDCPTCKRRQPFRLEAGKICCVECGLVLSDLAAETKEKFDAHVQLCAHCLAAVDGSKLPAHLCGVGEQFRKRWLETLR